ncbi:DNA mismatch repair protein [Heterostelium album PN500]|uniref:DNA mismatch repair protein n=1 Tax=Heterostelium pallidum (strain ATCC 26659 / Pp 5 / PN500) TaxID=670386 RepID=D3AYZ6_HETP5|nr:DNA mismatch repair protein [Heterostelium album PN500]EFA85686.1 DNA mismatch repair protein [Heterostelium album PN500]|eukprot:XP_020437793.1 DNA mismatch repair protein [Heterostelium album PN500]
MSEESNDRVLLKEDKGFLAFYKSLDKSDNVIRFFDRKGYYSLHCENAVYIAMLHFKSMKALKYWTESITSTPLKKARTDTNLKTKPNVSLLSSSSSSSSQDNDSNDGYACLTIREGIEFETVCQKLLAEKLRIEVWTPKPNRLNQWECSRHCSPGNMQMFEDILSVKGQSLMVALRVATVRGNRVIGAAFGDATLKSLGVLQFVDNEHLSNLGSFLLQMGVKECLIHIDDKNVDNKKVVEKLQDCDIPFTDVPNADFNVKNIEQDLTRLLGSVNNVLNELEQEYAMQSLSCLIKHLELLCNDRYFGKFKLETFNLDSYMRMDSATFRGLNIINEKESNQCNTPMGSRKLSQWIKQPLVDSEEIEKRLDFVEIFTNSLELRQSLRGNDLKKICDLDRLSKRFVGSKANLEDCVNLYDIVQRMPVLVSSLQAYDGQCAELISSTFVEPLQSIVANFSQYLAMVEQTIDLDRANESHELSRKDEKLISNASKYFTHATNKDGVRFSTTDLRRLSDECGKWSKQYAESQQALVDQALQVASSFVPIIDDLSYLIALLDVYVNLAHISSVAPTPFVRPKIFPMGTGDTVIIGGRHPCVEVQDGVNFIPNDIELNRERSQFHVITGPNMGGKSTFIRQVGVIILLAQIGCFVPAEEASISVVDCILTRIGAGDSQLRGVSTFMAEMLETSYILKTATKNSLIIIDELGRGTSTYDGFGLAWGIAEYICNQIGAYCLFATHFHELTVLAELIPVVNNLHVSANITDNRLTLLYKIENGSCDQSFGIHVAIMAGFPEEVIEIARSKASELESFESNSLKKNIHQFLEEFKSLNLDENSPDKGLDMVNNLLLKYQIDLD